MDNNKNENLFLNGDTAKRLYENSKALPIADYHCHLSPKEIYEDKQFDNIAQMWLDADHYKWRLMRAYGIEEEYITGDKPYYDKFIKYAECIGMAAGNPLYHWTKMELEIYFGITTPLNASTAEEIWSRANEVIKEKKLSPRKLISQSNVDYIATTDDIADSLEFHSKIKSLDSFKTKVCPSFRTDNMLLIRNNGYADYIKKLSDISGVKIENIDDLKMAIKNRLDFFIENECKFSDVGIEYFPSAISTEHEANEIFKSALALKPVTDQEFTAFLGYMYLFLANEYKKRNIIMQLHLAVKRNANSHLFVNIGADCGGDCIGDVINQNSLVNLFDAMNSKGGLPRTIIYTLNPQMYHTCATAAASFREVRLGAAWWFNDHLQGIKAQMEIYAQTLHFATFLGMLTDSRSFLSYARHDYFRRILCGVLGEWIDKGEFDNNNATEIIERICYKNIHEEIERQ